MNQAQRKQTIDTEATMHNKNANVEPVAESFYATLSSEKKLKYLKMAKHVKNTVCFHREEFPKLSHNEIEMLLYKQKTNGLGFVGWAVIVILLLYLINNYYIFLATPLIAIKQTIILGLFVISIFYGIKIWGWDFDHAEADAYEIYTNRILYFQIMRHGGFEWERIKEDCDNG